MSLRRKTLLSVFLALVMQATIVEMSEAQPVWLLPEEDRAAFTLEILKPTLQGYYKEGIKFSSSVWFIGARIPVSRQSALVFEIPFSHYDEDRSEDYPYYYWEYKAQNMIGNVFMGVEFGSSQSGVFGRIGVRPPTAPDNMTLGAAFYSWRTDYYRSNAFVPNVLSLSGFFGGRARFSSSPMQFRGGIGPTLCIITEDDADPELYLKCFAQLWYVGTGGKFGFGVSGNTLVTGEDLDFGELVGLEFGFSGQLVFGNLQPGISLRVPITSGTIALDKAVGFVIGLNLSVAFGVPSQESESAWGR
ncbi:MAG: hypothetical protein JSU65_08340 [Candidatus Zixiibacteriota bacterium]|nr:MAG: hypothetical protein JSU65_08340 [candidate division Zixibacteria bacterium]